MYLANVPADSITSFSGIYQFLSNFHPSAIIVDGEFYPTVEHAYQAAKTDDVDLKKKIRDEPEARGAKKIGRQVVLIPDWESIKIDVMRNLVRAKFNSHIDLKMKLLMTQNRHLVEGNTWKDDFWGVKKDGVGQNHLGKILMEVREEIRAIDISAFNVLLKFLEEKKLDDLNIHLKGLIDVSSEISEHMSNGTDPSIALTQLSLLVDELK